MRGGTDLLFYRGKKIRLYLYFNAVLDCIRILRRPDLDGGAKLDVSLAVLTDGSRFVRRLPPEEKAELYTRIFDEKINPPKRAGTDEGVKTVDLLFDWPLIRAAFLQNYQIDPERQYNRMHWRAFMALFQGLTGTKLNEVMQIRGMELPEPTRYNAAQLNELRKMKRYWALPLEVIGENYGEQLERMFTTLSKMAKGGQ